MQTTSPHTGINPFAGLPANPYKNKKRDLESLFFFAVVPPESLNHSFNTQSFSYLQFGNCSKKTISIIVSLDFFTILHRNQGVILGGF